MKAIALTAAFLLTAGLAQAQEAPTSPADIAGHFQARLRGAAVVPDPSATITISGANIGGVTKVSDSFIPEADLTYFITDNIAVEAIAAVTKHTVRNSVAGTVSSVWLLPPTITAQYHFDPNGPIRPYVGAGVNYTNISSVNLPLGLTLDHHSFGLALQAGADFRIDKNWSINLDIKKVQIRSDVTTGGVKVSRVKVDPLLIGLGVGYRF